MKSKRTLAIAASMLIATTLTGCANLKTVGRTTQIKDGTAIHLDAQQRLVLVANKHKLNERDKTKYVYCAEPSPDAMSSYAASLALGLSVPGQGDASLVNTLKSATGNIGLRTQSITLMRDALYRICEAYNNGGLDEEQVNKLFRRSQNLTAVVLAVEQLTGAVSPKLVPLTNVRASANLVQRFLDEQQLLDQAKDRVQRRQEKVNAAENELSKIRDSRGADEETTKGAENNLKYAKERLKDAIEVRDAIQASRNDALTNVTAETQGSGQFSIPVQPHLNAKAAKEIATAVKEMVIEVITENDVFDTCLSGKNGNNRNKSEACEQIAKALIDIKDKEGQELRTQVDKLREQAEASDKQIKELHEEAEASDKQIKELREEAEASGKQIKELREEAEASDKQIKELREEAEASDKQIEELREQTEESGKQIEKLSEQTEELNEQTEASGKQIEKLSEQTEELNEQTEESGKQIEKLSEQTEELNEQTEESGKQIKKLREQTDKLREQTEPSGE